MRRIPGRCYLCGDPCISKWFCAAHLWAQGYFIDDKRPPVLRVEQMKRRGKRVAA